MLLYIFVSAIYFKINLYVIQHLPDLNSIILDCNLCFILFKK